MASLSGSRLCQLLQNSLLQGLGLGGASPATLDVTIPANEELLKVPLDNLQAQQARLLLLEPGEQRVGVVAVDIGLLHDGEADAIVDLAEVLDLIVGAGLLGAELVAGEAEDLKVFGVLGLDALVDLLETFVLRCETTLGGSVDDEDDLALVVGGRDLLSALCTIDG